ncbi:hypothetical protein [Roseateles saccharophilus]|nr:hypothetical protein [Roseateles saccharophilus]MDG0832992.1 hypothetical protein [Roseateles saccharophilus]
MIWNRACFGGEGSERAGDVALNALLKFHGLAMNGGVLHAVECLTQAELINACKGFQYFGFEVLASDIEEANRALAEGDDSHEDDFDERYGRHVPSDQVLFSAFQLDYERRPENYESVLSSEIVCARSQ